nr:hypothetical protein CFP56_59866 [Quercus suber]
MYYSRQCGCPTECNGVVSTAWACNPEGTPMAVATKKIKKCKKMLKAWNKDRFGSVLQKIKKTKELLWKAEEVSVRTGSIEEARDVIHRGAMWRVGDGVYGDEDGYLTQLTKREPSEPQKPDQANDKATRISMAVSHGPSLDTIVSAAPELVDNETQPTPPYNEMSTYREFYELQQSGKIGYKLGLEVGT